MTHTMFTLRFGVDLSDPRDIADARLFVRNYITTFPVESREAVIDTYKEHFAPLGITEEEWTSWLYASPPRAEKIMWAAEKFRDAVRESRVMILLGRLLADRLKPGDKQAGREAFTVLHKEFGDLHRAIEMSKPIRIVASEAEDA